MRNLQSLCLRHITKLIVRNSDGDPYCLFANLNHCRSFVFHTQLSEAVRNNISVGVAGAQWWLPVSFSCLILSLQQSLCCATFHGCYQHFPFVNSHR